MSLFPIIPGIVTQAYPVVAATNTSTASETTTFACALPTSISSGDLLILFIGARNSPSITTPSGYTALIDTDSGAHNLGVFYKSASGSEGSSVDVTVSATNSGAMTSYRITGWSAVEGTAAVGTIDPPSETASWGASKNLWLTAAMNSDSSDNVGTAPSGFGSRVMHADGANTTLGTAQKNDATATLDPAAWGNAGSASQSCTVVIQPA